MTMPDKNNWYSIDDVQELDSPALVVYPARVKENIRLAIELCGDSNRLRPHVKTHKSPDVTRLMLDAGITKFKCATIAEAEMLAVCGASDVLLAYQLSGPKLQRFARLVQAHPITRFSCLVDNSITAEEQSAVFVNAPIDVYIDLNVGMNRTGIAPSTGALDLYRYCASLPGLAIRGLHAYDGHIRHPDIEQRRQLCDNDFTPVLDLRTALQREGFQPVIVAGGSHSFPVHASRTLPDLECSPGTFVYWDRSNSDYCPEQPFLQAVLVVARVLSLPAPGKICIDLGHKSIAAENEITRRVFFIGHADWVPVSQSEEHLVVEAGLHHSLHPGDVLYGVPYHVCPTVALYEKAITIEAHRVSGEWRTVARDRVLRF